MDEFDLQTTTVPTGLSVIEASAGTGKTWTITHLLPRLLLDGTVNEVGEILLVSFTEDTARELRERTRRQLELLVSHADDGTKSRDGETGVHVLLERLNALTAVDREKALLRLRLALHESDHLAVSTIHSFCKQVLTTESFLCGMPSGFEVLPDTAQLRADAVKDTWRADLATDALLAAVAAFGDWSVKKDLKDWALLTQRPSTRMAPEPLSLEAARARLVQALESLQAARPDIRLIQEIAARAKVRLNQSSRNPGQESVERLDGWYGQLETLNPHSPSLEIFDLVRRLAVAASWFSSKSTAGKAASTEVRTLGIVQAAADIQSHIGSIGWTWLAHLRDAAGRRFRRSLRHHNNVTYDELIGRLHQALCGGPNGAVLSQRLANKWKVGLIDESQDTDSRQLDIFRAIFDRGTGSGRLILVGDPKQAIYSFRGGDLEAYLDARPADSTRISQLATTYRSAEGLVMALNALFGRKNAFGVTSLPYPKAEAVRQDHELPLPADGCGRLVAWVLPLEDADGWRYAEQRRARAAECTATAIVALLGRPMGTAADRVNPAHIAVLTRTNREARLVYEALRGRGVPTVVRDDGDVMQSEIASDLATILKAVLLPTHHGWRHAAMATRLFGYDSAKLAALTKDDAEQWLARFSEWEGVWRNRGVAGLIARFDAQSEVSLRLARTHSGERDLTDLRHLAELLQTREGAGYRSPERLLQWFEDQRISEDSASDERLYRLETDDDAVQVATVHRAKGLQFDFVYCPYLWSVPESRAAGRLLARRDGGWVLTDRTHQDSDSDHRTATTERLREDLRLTYVALTRARRRVTLLGGPLGYTPRAGTPPSALDWLLRADEETESIETWYQATEEKKKNLAGCEHRETLRNLQLKHPSLITISDPPVPRGTTWASRNRTSQSLDTRAAPALNLQAWHLTSFSQLAHGHHQERERRDAVLTEPEISDIETTRDLLDASVPLEAFARGTHAGNCLHEILEFWDFQTEPEPLIAHSLQRHRLDSEQAASAISATLHNLKRSSLSNLNVNLETAASDRALAEWEFLLPLSSTGITGEGLSEIFARHARNDEERAYARDLTSLVGQTLSGMLTGYIDRLVRAERGWGVVDWKSNYLGSHYADYSRPALWRCAAQQHYLLQVHLYLVALRRYLRLFHLKPLASSLSGYLLFLRGVRPNTNLGVLEITPSESLLDDLETLFRSSTTEDVP